VRTCAARHGCSETGAGASRDQYASGHEPSRAGGGSRVFSAKAGGIPEGSLLPEGTVAGTAGVGRGNYFGPRAPAGPRYHHYVFELYALSKMLDLPVDATRQLLDAMKDIITGKAAYVGRFRQ
jgi:phosphatidylethanolamine-binding protein (PEBP) family uncharacterized protein